MTTLINLNTTPINDISKNPVIVDPLKTSQKDPLKGFIKHDPQHRRIFQKKKSRAQKICDLKEIQPSHYCLTISSLQLINQNLDKFPRCITELKNLTDLNLRRNPFHTILREFSVLQKLTCLNLSKSELREFPACLYQITTLKILSLAATKLICLPINISHLKNLQQLDLSKTPISYLPKGFCDLHNLKTLNLSNVTTLRTLPKDFGDLELEALNVKATKPPIVKNPSAYPTTLRELNLSHTNPGPLLSWVSHLTNLTMLINLQSTSSQVPDALRTSYPNCQFITENDSTIDQTITKLVKWSHRDLGFSPPIKTISVLNLTHRFLEEIPQEIRQLNNLTTINFSCNNLKQVPAAIGTLTNLTSVDFSNNLIGGFHDSFWNLHKIQILNLNNNPLLNLGPIEKFTDLTKLMLINCKLAKLPPSITNLTNLQELDLALNSIKALPKGFGNLANLERLNLTSNKIVALSRKICKLTALKTLSIMANPDLETLPAKFGHLTNLESLNLSYTNVINYPESCKSLTSLTMIHFVGMKRWEKLPEWLAQLSNLQILDLQYTHVPQLPDWIYLLKKLETLNLNKTRIGFLPSLLSLKKLSRLNLSMAKVEGFSKDFRWPPNLEHLDLSWVKSLEQLPPGIEKLLFLKTVNLSHTLLQEIPEFFKQLPLECKINFEKTFISKEQIIKFEKSRIEYHRSFTEESSRIGISAAPKPRGLQIVNGFVFT